MKVFEFNKNDNKGGILMWADGTCEAFIASGICRKFKTLKGATKWLNKHEYVQA